MKFRTFLLASTVAIAVCGSVQADTSSSLRHIFYNCGLGGILVPEDKTIALVVNILTSLPTATTQGLLAPGSCEGRHSTSASFVAQTYDQLMIETTIGEGPYLTALMNHNGCQAADHPRIVSYMRDDLSELTDAPEYASMAREDRAEELFVSLYGAVDTSGAACTVAQ